MNGCIKLFVCVLFFFPQEGQAQEKPGRWDLKSCIDYALSRNIEIKKSGVALNESLETAQQAKAQLLPSLSFSTGQNMVNRPQSSTTDRTSYSGNYSLSSSLTVYNGGKLNINVQQQELQCRIQELSIREAEDNIELSITNVFLQLLYANEAVTIGKSTVELSAEQLKRAQELQRAGSLSRTDVAQLESQYSSDKYQLVLAVAAFDDLKLQLKQLLELGVTEELEVAIPELSDSLVLSLLPSRLQVYQASLEVMPQIKYQRLSVDVARLERTKALAAGLPVVNLTAGVSSGHSSGTGFSFLQQLKSGFSESVGLTLSVPIFANRSARTAVKIAGLNIEATELNYQRAQKDLLTSVERVWLDATSSQDRFRAATESLNAVRLSYRLTEEQFYLGMKNTVELLTEKNNLLSAQQEVVQAKYMAILNQLLLDFYQGRPILLQGA